LLMQSLIEWDFNMISADDFEDLLNDNPEIEILGRKFKQGTVLRKLDQTAFIQIYNDYCDSVEEELENELSI
jgi:hypothetical protein